MIYHTNHHFGIANWNSYHGNHSYAGTNPYPTHSAQSYINKRHPARHSGIHRGWHSSGYYPEPPYNPQPQVPNQLRYSNYCLVIAFEYVPGSFPGRKASVVFATNQHRPFFIGTIDLVFLILGFRVRNFKSS